MRYFVHELAARLQAKVHGDSEVQVQQLRSLEQATAQDISYVKDAHFLPHAQVAQAGVLVVPPELVEALKDQCVLLEVAQPYLAFAQLTHLFANKPSIKGIATTAVIHSSARLGEQVSIGDYVVIGENVVIGAGSIIYPHSFIDNGVQIGARAYIESNVSILNASLLGDDVRIHANTSIGGEGFGYAPYQGRWHRIAQLGKVQIGNRVRIGSNCSIDRGALDDTQLADGVIIDNLVQIAHNVKIGKNTAIAAKCGIAGSTTIGANCILAGACGVVGHIQIADGVQLTGMSMVTKSITQAGVYSSGTGLFHNKVWKKAVVGLRQLSEHSLKKMAKQLNQLQGRLQALEEKLSSQK